ncbi:hypothetical protein NEPAR06_1274 [Nematocida parisii]|uniref:Brl1/Brr6 domain-containing protein n=1 Tax=Nematocida parisii (strain ERTm3) TaxID=935791 RepID=I3EHN8_NEMP3|nr:uncharacterized protein NEPG_00516 [Nematocida parisii ERTm1]EIJ88735.1 hypothetical protein NEQG_01425 [Nematocida parisii ERTm3]KAI5127024.1 hypothetical protein NEPAR03_0772 [Nematocida parisii]EIJ94991.1 hypothetical protein NEPG_00516 [Nematocida parisii ERTm1]KAI5128340.1 hypothetical protein NEPAR08_1204 [Nematocida parisii]KAI5140791.1 hypothetical protein NEPAR04_0508 [Nematocida parisii]|eukprot:XP_013058347.1 hypothetical protein NEPG_00516 [Nematocida parisii ERTm1]
MGTPADINWGEREPRRPISKSHPYEFFSFSNPKKRKADDQIFKPSAMIDHERFLPVKKPQNAQPQASMHHEKLLKINLILQAYLSLILNVFIVGLMILLVVKGVVMIKNDIEVRVNTSIMDQKTRISDCAREYRINRCNPEDRVPAVEKQCQEWEKCMAQDPIKQELSKIVLRMLSEGAEELMGSLSVRTVALATVALVIVLKYRK